MSNRARLFAALTLVVLPAASGRAADAGAAATNAPTSACRSKESAASAGVSGDTTRARAVEAYGRLPLAFEANAGQHDGAASFLARGDGYALWLTAGEAVFSLRAPTAEAPAHERGPDETHTLSMRVLGGDPTAPARAEDRVAGVVNRFSGSDPSHWRTNVPSFSRVRYASVYPGIDLVYYGNQRQLEYDFVVGPGADPSAIALQFAGAERVTVGADGGLVLDLGGRALHWDAPVVYQTVGGERVPVRGAYRLLADGSSTPAVGFTVSAFDRSLPLVIDPILRYSTFLGGASVEIAYNVAVDSYGDAYVTGYTTSVDFPTRNPWQAANAGSHDVFVTKLQRDGGSLVYSTYLGGTGSDYGYGIALDATREAYVTGKTNSVDFPATPGAYDTTHNGGDDVFVARLDADGALVYATYVGSNANEQGEDIAVQEGGRAYVTGFTASAGFPTTAGAYDRIFAGAFDGFVLRLAANGSALSYSTLLGGVSQDYGYGITILGSEAYVAGYTVSSDFPVLAGAHNTFFSGADAFVTRLSASGGSLVASTFVGGMFAEAARDITLGPAGNVYITGWTTSLNFPISVGAYDATHNGSMDLFVSKLDPTLATMLYSTYVGGTGYDLGEAIAVNLFGAALVTGYTESADFPTVDPVQAVYGGLKDAFLLRVEPGGVDLNFSTFLGSTGNDHGEGVAVDGCGDPITVGEAGSGFPVTAGSFDDVFNGGLNEAFVTKIQP